MFVAEHEKHLPQYGLFTAGNISLVMDDGGCVIPESYRLGGALKDTVSLPLLELGKLNKKRAKAFRCLTRPLISILSRQHICIRAPKLLHDMMSALHCCSL